MVAMMQEEKSNRSTLTVALPPLRRKLKSGKSGARLASGTATIRMTAAPGPGDCALHEFRLSLEILDAHYVPEEWANEEAVRLIQKVNAALAQNLTGQ